MNTNQDKLHVFDSLSQLTPFDIDVSKLKIGPSSDGSYILASLLDSSEPVLSYGIGSQWGFDTEMAERGHDIFMFDHTIPVPELKYKNMVFRSEGVASEPSKSLQTIEHHLHEFIPKGGSAILKMDVEGAEWDVFSSIDPVVLGRFSQILLEVHDLHRLTEFAYRAKFKKAFAKINETFTLFHVHGNNYVPIKMVSGFAVCPVMELSFVRTSLVRRSKSKTLYPTSLDRPNYEAGEDHLLWFYPFMPTEILDDQLKINAYRNYALANLPGIFDE